MRVVGAQAHGRVQILGRGHPLQEGAGRLVDQAGDDPHAHQPRPLLDLHWLVAHPPPEGLGLLQGLGRCLQARRQLHQARLPQGWDHPEAHHSVRRLAPGSGLGHAHRQGRGEEQGLRELVQELDETPLGGPVPVVDIHGQVRGGELAGIVPQVPEGHLVAGSLEEGGQLVGEGRISAQKHVHQDALTGA